MEIVTTNHQSNGNSIQKKEDKQMLVLLHLSQLLIFCSGIGGLIVPILLWQLKKNEIINMDEQGKEVTNFQISIFVYALLCIPLILLLGLGFIGLIVLLFISIIFPIINAIKANDGSTDIKYPLTIKFF